MRARFKKEESMASNEKEIIARYGNGKREQARASSGRADYNTEFYYTKRLLDKYIRPGQSVLELGCGTGYYGLHLAGRAQYTGIDIAPGNIARFEEEIKARNLQGVKALVGDAACLPPLPLFDAVLTLGPMYHLPPEERDLVFAESKRVCKPGGLLFYAYINKAGVYLPGCLRSDAYPNRQKNQTLLHEGIDDTRENIYYFTMPEEMLSAARRFSLTVLENRGLDFALLPLPASPEQQAALDELSDFLHAHPSCAGLSNHALMVCRKE